LSELEAAVCRVDKVTVPAHKSANQPRHRRQRIGVRPYLRRASITINTSLSNCASGGSPYSVTAS
jgi:hypothetical protein